MPGAVDVHVGLSWVPLESSVMHLSPQTLSANGSSPWIIVGPLQRSFGLGLFLTFSEDANLTATVQHTGDDPMQNQRAVTLSRTTTTLTITDTSHKLITGDNIFLDASGDVTNTWPGSYDVTVVDANTYTVTVANSGAATSTGKVRSFRVFNFDDASLVGVTGTPPTRVDGHYDYPIAATRLHVASYSAGSATLTVQQGSGI